ncbi:MAG TPA: DUF2069 domain-containing protein [Steroidobacteraceae bacterium]|nr:DUF2069 domain-containing protein [Steroidobacteraceae bacterium]
MNAQAHPTAAARRANQLALVLTGALLAVVLAWQLADGLTARNAVVAAILGAPLLLPIKGLWQGSRYTHAWATLCVIPYFIVGTVEAIANPAARIWSAVCLALSLALFAALIAYLRLTRSSRE